MAGLENGPGALVLGTADRASAVAAIKARLRVASDDEDALVAAFAETALGLCERVIGQAVIARAMTQSLIAWGGLAGGWQRLAARPVRSIDAVTGADGQPLTVADHDVAIDGDGIGWVRIAAGQAARVTFTAGIASGWDTLPAALREGAAMLAAHLFDDRTGQAPIPAAVTALWRPFRIVRLTAEARREPGRELGA